MNFALAIPALLSCLLFAAHFLRAGTPLFSLLSLGATLFLVPNKPAPTRVLQAFLLLATLEWLRTLYVIVSERLDTGQRWHAAFIILAGVAAFTLLSAILLEWRLRRRHLGRAAVNPAAANQQPQQNQKFPV